jgi:adenylate cyclase
MARRAWRARSGSIGALTNKRERERKDRNKKRGRPEVQQQNNGNDNNNDDGAGRSLAAVMFTDLVSFTSLTQKNEALAMKVLAKHNSLLRPIFPKHRGREVKAIGDSFLVEFASALDATLCAVEIQELLRSYNKNLGEQEKAAARGDNDEDDGSVGCWKIELRIGIHLGDVIHKLGDIFGDAVNIASRIRPIAEPGGVCVSEQVFYQVRNKVPFEFLKLEHKDLKNLRFPVDVYKIVIPAERMTEREEGEEGRQRTLGRFESGLPGGTKKRIAIIPFVNMSPDPNDEYFADGLTEELISELSRVRELGVIARTSVMRYKNSDKSISDIARELRVEAILEGSVRKSGKRIRIVVQLIDASSEEHLWTDKYDEELEDIFAVQSEIARNVAQALQIELAIGGGDGDEMRKRRMQAREEGAVSVAKSEQEKARSTVVLPHMKEPTRDLDAYTLYLKGRFLWNERTNESIKEALKLFERAVSRDPNFALAYSGMADCYSLLIDRLLLPEHEWYRAMESARKALELDPNLPEARASLGLILLQDYDFSGAEKELKRAIELNPGYASAHHWYSNLLLSTGKLEEAYSEMRRAEEADPLSSAIALNVASLEWLGGKVEKFFEESERALSLDRGNALVHSTRAFFYALRPDKEEEEAALREIRLFESLAPAEPVTRASVGVVYGLLGMERESRQVLAELLKAAKTEKPPPAGEIAELYLVLNDRDKYFEWAFRAAEERTLSFISLLYPAANPHLESLKSDERYGKLLRSCNVPDQ